jgi:parallel beta-helix repeat protein
MRSDKRLGFLFACLPTLLLSTTALANDLCGATIVTTLTLDHDLNCTAEGLIIGADGITVNLNGYTITGTGSGIGIDVVGRTTISITGGIVRNFAAGVRLNTSTDVVIHGNEFRENGDGIDVQSGSWGNTIKENHFRNSRTRGVMLRGGTADNVIKENTFTGNRVGILLFAPVETLVKENVLSASGLAAIRVNVFATRNLVVENTITSNPAGIDFIVTSGGTAAGNTFVENTIAMNTCGLSGPTTGNTFRENLFEGNGSDACP